MGACTSIEDDDVRTSTSSVPAWMTEPWRYHRLPRQTSTFRKTHKVLSVLLNVDLLRQMTVFQPGMCRMVRYLLCRWQRQTGPYAKAHFIVYALPSDHPVDRLYLVSELHHAHPLVLSRTLMDLFAKAGYVECVQFMHDHFRHGCTRNAMDLAAAGGHLDVVTFLHTHRFEGCSTDAIDFAAAGGHLEVVAFLHTHRPEGFTRHALHFAAAHGHVDVVAYLQTHRNCGVASTTTSTTSSAQPVAFPVTVSAPSVDASSQLVPFTSGYRHEWLTLTNHNRRARRLVLPVTDDNTTRDNNGDNALGRASREQGEAVAMELNAMEWAVLHGHVDVVAYLHRLNTEPASSTSSSSTSAWYGASVHVLELASLRGHDATTVAYIHAHNLVLAT
ncbi:hypothetical protein DYB31_007767 [Aphanomyces astaci]|uniref:Uncharacterized protein n=1 Tax=Aphanomyces astaci TaxID=112090 RepID=A0A397EHW0_APHAT|nr:hypothetical protein DYB31_007767 [Aphanomyces astaci]